MNKNTCLRWIMVGLLAVGGGVTAVAEFAEGDGSSEYPFQIETAEHLNAVRNHLDAHFVQTADIDLDVAPWNEGSGWVPIGTEDEPFIGTYDGNGLEVQGLFINRPAADYQGLFGYAEGARIENVGIAGFAITAANRSGGLGWREGWREGSRLHIQ